MTIRIKTILKALLQFCASGDQSLAFRAEPQSLNQIKAIADYFDISVDYLVYVSNIKKYCLKETLKEPIEQFEDQINAGVFEFVLRRIRR